MKRIQELTAIHYRRSVKRSAFPNTQNVDLQGRCPVCGARLAVIVAKDSMNREGANTAQKATFHLVQKGPDED
jgi:hypothetical protein